MRTHAPTRLGRRFKVSLALGSAALMTAMSTPALADDTTRSSGGWLPEIKDSREITGSALITGTVRKPDGKTAANAYVYATAWPDGEALGQLEEGDDVPTRVIAKTRADSNGNYQLRVANTLQLAGMTSAAGNVDVDITATDGSPDDIATDSLSLRVSSASADMKRTAGGVANLSLAQGEEDPVIKPVNRDLRMERYESESDGKRAGVGAKFANGCPVTGEKYLRSLGKRWVSVGMHYQTGPSGAKATYRYSTSAEASLAVGMSKSGKFGTFSGNGSLKRSTSASIGFGTQGPKTGIRHYTMYKYGLYCNTSRSPGPDFTFYAKPTSFAGGAKSVKSAYPKTPKRNCVPHKKGSDFVQDKSKMSSYSKGVKLDDVIGVDLTSQSGYTRSSSLKFEFPKAAQLCGTKGLPGNSPGLLVARGAGF
ncbi:hypothetical protein GL263_19785 [Streptomyces durbertensis]|uniref:Carboxypeptidase regulatory-like domain-containing protein n=1 Tax=Streptomyces durbertensis TaxID=2448886 RepID=A0ABR6EKA9_9ACTN|nr:hypothetical protein [Streptomyces durbertensis]MBB1245779.1 hypothetical protein [Streptomyces durbertensis]